MKKILYGVLIVVAFLLFTGCKEKVDGNYKLVELSRGNEIYTKELINQLGLDFELTFNNDNTASLKMGNEIQTFTYNEEAFIGTKSGEQLSFPYSISGKKITINFDDEKMVFEK